jgi:hypothetical protein
VRCFAVGTITQTGATRLPGPISDMVPLSDAANAAGIPKLDVALYGTGYGPGYSDDAGEAGCRSKGHARSGYDIRIRQSD